MVTRAEHSGGWWWKDIDLNEQDTSTIPGCFHKMLKYLERKQTVRGSKQTAEDYSEAGLMQPISKQR